MQYLHINIAAAQCFTVLMLETNANFLNASLKLLQDSGNILSNPCKSVKATTF
jgi:hypothetical protein